MVRCWARNPLTLLQTRTLHCHTCARASKGFGLHCLIEPFQQLASAFLVPPMLNVRACYLPRTSDGEMSKWRKPSDLQTLLGPGLSIMRFPSSLKTTQRPRPCTNAGGDCALVRMASWVISFWFAPEQALALVW